MFVYQVRNARWGCECPLSVSSGSHPSLRTTLREWWWTTYRYMCICDTHPSSYCYRHMIYSSPLCPAALSWGGGFERPPDVSRQLLEIRDPGPDSADPLHMQLLIPTHTALRPARAQRTPSQTQPLQRERLQPAPGLLAARHRRHEGPVERYECLCLHSSSS